MESGDVIELYKKGHSVDYIINEYYKSVKREKKTFKTSFGRFVFTPDCPSKGECRGYVFKIIYDYIRG